MFSFPEILPEHIESVRDIYLFLKLILIVYDMRYMYFLGFTAKIYVITMLYP